MSLEEPVSGIAVSTVHKISSEASVLEAASLMLEKDVSCLVVSSESAGLRIVTERDILRKVTARARDPSAVRVGEIMSEYLITIPARASIGEAAKKMVENKIRRLVILDDERRLTALVTMTDLIRWMAKQEQITDSLMNYLMYAVV